ncbi:out at first protein homolog [Tachysurus ichikawai]
MYPSRVLAASLRNSLLLLLLLLSVSVCSELKVLVRLNDGQITAETLESDSERDIISVEFRHTDGTLITFLADFKRVSGNTVKNNQLHY